MKRILIGLTVAILAISICACGDENNSKEKVEGVDDKVDIEDIAENISPSLKMEKVEVGKYSFMIPDNGNKKFSNGDDIQTFYSNDGGEGVVWYSLDGPIELPNDEAAALTITSTSGKIVEFEKKSKNGHEYAFIINEVKDRYEGLMLVVSESDAKDCVWLSVKGTDKKLIEEILSGLTW